MRITVKDAEGTAVPGATVKLKAIGSGSEPVYVNGSGTIVAEAVDHTDATGLVTFTVTANASLIPSDSYYQVSVKAPSERKERTFNVQIPAVGSTFDVEDVLHDPGTIVTSALASHKLSVADHGDVDLTGNATGKVLMWDGTSFVPADTHATDLEVSSAVLVETNARTAADTTLQTNIDNAAAAAAVDATTKANQAETDAKRVDGTSLGDSSYDGATVTLDFDTKWGIDGSGDPYYDAEGVTGSEAAVLVVNPDGSLAVKKPTTALTDNWNDSPAEVQTNLDTHEARTDNPHSVTKSQVGLANVDNTSDANKPVSSATQSVLDAKVSRSLYDANSILKADLDDTPGALSVAEGRLLGRLSGGSIAGLARDDVLGLLGMKQVWRTTDAAPIRSNTTPASDDTLKWDVGAGEVWFFKAWLRIGAATNTMDVKFGWSAPGMTMFWGSLAGLANELPGFGSRSTGNIPIAQLTESGTLSVGVLVGTSLVGLAGWVIGGASDSVANLQVAQNTSEANDLIVRAHSFLDLLRRP